jgi:hypothetical protein
MFSEKVMLVIFTFQLPASATGVIVTKAAAAITTVIITAKMVFFMVLLPPTQYASMSLEAIGFANRPECLLELKNHPTQGRFAGRTLTSYNGILVLVRQDKMSIVRPPSETLTFMSPGRLRPRQGRLNGKAEPHEVH